jgi:hypothetical protein
MTKLSLETRWDDKGRTLLGVHTKWYGFSLNRRQVQILIDYFTDVTYAADYETPPEDPWRPSNDAHVSAIQLRDGGKWCVLIGPVVFPLSHPESRVWAEAFKSRLWEPVDEAALRQERERLAALANSGDEDE